MIRGLFSAATGMQAQQEQINITSNNIANVNTVGFKSDRAEFQDLMYEGLNYSSGLTSENTRNPTGLHVGLGTRIENTQKNFSNGSLKQTNQELDVAITGKGFFNILAPDGTIKYTRNGAFKVSNTGILTNGEGFAVSPEIVIPDNITNISIGTNGQVSGLDEATQTTVQLGQIQLTNFINPAGLKPIGGNLYESTAAAGDPQDGVPGTGALGETRQGMLEMSNVALVTEMIDLITAQRAYESNARSIKTTDEMLQQINQLKN